MYIWLSHELEESTPPYAGGSGFSAVPDKKISDGDSCNTSLLTLSNHIGTHIDAPKHFDEKGVTIGDYSPAKWIYNQVLIIDVNIAPAEIIDINTVKSSIDRKVKDAELVLIRTGFEKYRNDDKYWENSPAISPELCGYFKKKYPSFTTIGMDLISISSFQHRELGREAHREFLGNGIRIIEDMSFRQMSSGDVVEEILVSPLRFRDADGCPVTIIAKINRTNWNSL